MNVQYEKIKFLNFQEIASFLFIISVIISIYLLENEKKMVSNKKYKNLDKLEEFNRYFVIALLIIFIYINYKFYDIAKYEKKKLRPYTLQNYASIISLVTGFIALYAYYDNKSGISGIENPII